MATSDFEAGRQEGARLALDTLADNCQVAAARLGAFAEAVSAANEAAAILRDAAKEMQYKPSAIEEPTKATGVKRTKPKPKES